MSNQPPHVPTNPPQDLLGESVETQVLSAADLGQPTDEAAASHAVQPAPAAGKPQRTTAGRGWAPQRLALVVLVGMVALAVAFIIMIFVNVTGESIIALAVVAMAIATMVAAYYGITLSMQQVRSERAEKEKAIARADAADAASRETEVWAAQMESGLRVAMAKLGAAGIGTDEVTKAAGTPEGFF
jgi:ABC-type nickel/cobalt efflux system permease component RcnA